MCIKSLLAVRQRRHPGLCHGGLWGPVIQACARWQWWWMQSAQVRAKTFTQERVGCCRTAIADFTHVALTLAVTSLNQVLQLCRALETLGTILLGCTKSLWKSNQRLDDGTSWAWAHTYQGRQVTHPPCGEETSLLLRSFPGHWGQTEKWSQVLWMFSVFAGSCNHNCVK